MRCAYCHQPILPHQSYRMLAVDGPWPEVYRNIHLHTPGCAQKWEEEHESSVLNQRHLPQME